MDGILRYAVREVAGGIGLASESIKAHRQRSRSRKNNHQNTEGTTAHEGQSQDISQERQCQESLSQARPPQHDYKPDEVSLSGEQNLEEQWGLDETQDEITPVQQSPAQRTPQDAAEIIASFVKNNPPPPYAAEPDSGGSRLPLPVILPQRRPKSRSRGFIRAYAPVLEACDIDQAMFLDFLDTFEKASQASPWLNAINLAGIGTMFIPGVAGFLAGLAIQMSVMVAIEVQARSRTNTFLDTINATFFQPRGLYCLIMTWNPESEATSSTIDITSVISSSLTTKSTAGKFKDNLKSSSGKTYGDLDFPEPAPLVFPALDKLQDDAGVDSGKKKDKLKSRKKFVSDYYDRRAQAKFSGKNPTSALAQQVSSSSTSPFKSRYADPNHPASSGSLISLVTGGHINPPSLSRGGGLGGGLGGHGGGLGSLLSAATQSRGRINDRQAQAFTAREGASGLPTQQNRQVGLGGLPSLGGPQGIKKFLRKNVLYMMIVNMPSEEEMAAARAQMSQPQ